MDWFQKITGFAEQGYAKTRSLLSIHDGYLVSEKSNRKCAVGKLTLTSLNTLRTSVPRPCDRGMLKVTNASADVRELHSVPENNGAVFQVASQFNMLEMIDPDITPEDGVTRYQFDKTQGPACAMAGGAATIFRNYFAQVGEKSGQTATNQLNGLEGLAATLGDQLGMNSDKILPVRNGYALPCYDSLVGINRGLESLNAQSLRNLEGALEVGVHVDVEVTDQTSSNPNSVTQVFCSAMPVGYSNVNASLWEPLARLILNSAYEATLWAGLRNKLEGRSQRVFLTRLGGGAFGNRDSWIDDAMKVALAKFRGSGLEVIIVSYGEPPQSMLDLSREFGGN